MLTEIGQQEGKWEWWCLPQLLQLECPTLVWIRGGDPIRREKGRRKPEMTVALCLYGRFWVLQGVKILCPSPHPVITGLAGPSPGLSGPSPILLRDPSHFTDSSGTTDHFWVERGLVEFLFRVQSWYWEGAKANGRSKLNVAGEIVHCFFFCLWLLVSDCWS